VETVISGRYEILKSLGGGGMGQVYLARDSVLEREIALKVIKTADEPGQEEQQQFLDEARAVAALRHPNTVRVFDHGYHQSEGRHSPFIAMEFIEGQMLGDFLRGRGRDGLNVAETVEVALQIADAMEEAHCRGILHRDLKPGNVMLTRLGRFSTFVKVLDFGLALRFSIRAGSSGKAAISGIAGTPFYMAPEQLLGYPLDARADIYALGVLLYEMLSGRLPLKYETMVDMQRALLQEIPRPLDELLPDISLPGLLVETVRSCLEKSPDARPASMTVVVDRLLQVREKCSRSHRTAATHACSNCHAPTVPDSLFCNKCGTRLGASSCPQCNGSNDSGAAWCAHCGHKLHTEAQTVSLTPKVVSARLETVHQTDPTTASASLRYCTVCLARVQSMGHADTVTDADDMFAAEEQFRTMITELAIRHRGAVIQASSHESMLLFGWDAATEHDALHAVQAAFALHKIIRPAVGGFNSTSDRIVLCSGLMKLRGSPSTAGFSVAGEPINTARALLLARLDGQLLLDRSTFRQVRWECGQYTPQSASQSSREGPPISCISVTGQRLQTGAGSPPAISRPKVLMVGREAPLDQLRMLLERTLFDNEFNSVVITGPAGIGKTRISLEFIDHASKLDDFIDLRYWDCSKLDAGRPLEPFISDILSRCGVSIQSRSAEREARLTASFERLFSAAGLSDEIPPAVAAAEIARLSAPTAPSGFDDQSYTHLADKTREEIGLATIAAFYQALASKTPLLLVFDNVQYLPSNAQKVLAALQHHLTWNPALLVMTCPDSEHIQRLERVVGTNLQELGLRPLGRGEIEALLDRLTVGFHLPVTLSRRIIAMSGGNPLFVEEIVESLREEGMLTGRESATSTMQYLPVPPTLESLMQARLDRLPEADRQLLLAASVMGEQFWSGALTELLGPINERQLSALEETGMVRRQSLSLVPAEQQYEFHQQLLRNVLYERLPRNQRCTMHGIVARWLQSKTGAKNGWLAGQVARHLEAAGSIQEALPHLLEYGRVVEEEYANDEAIASYISIVTWEEQHTEHPPERIGDYYLPAVFGASRVALRTGQYTLARKTAAAALALVKANHTALLQANLNPNGRTLQLAQILGEICEASGDWPAALKYYQLVEKGTQARGAGPNNLLHHVLARTSAVQYWLGQYDSARKTIARGLALPGMTPAAEAAFRNVLAGCLVQAGDFIAAGTEFETAAAAFSAAGDRVQEGKTQNNVAAIHALSGRLDKAEANYRKAIDIHTQSGYLEGKAIALCNLGELFLDSDRTAKAVETLLQAERIAAEIGGSGYRSGILSLLAKAHFDQNESALARKAARTALALARQTSSAEYQARANKVLGQILRASEITSDQEQGCKMLNHAAELYQELGNDAEADNCKIRSSD
jgi:serine/threonine protein kinase/tetratricopeptide (TPR) repeat protein